MWTALAATLVANLEHKLRTERETSAKWERQYREEQDKG